MAFGLERQGFLTHKVGMLVTGACKNLSESRASGGRAPNAVGQIMTDSTND